LEKFRYRLVANTKALVIEPASYVRLFAVPEMLLADSVTAEFTVDPVYENVEELFASITKTGIVEPAAVDGASEDMLRDVGNKTVRESPMTAKMRRIGLTR